MTLNNEQQIKELEQAILGRAEGLAHEFQAKAAHQRDTLLRDMNERLHLAEQRETFIAKEAAERKQRRTVQAGELKMQGRMDQLRWELVLEVRDLLLQRLTRFRQERELYQQWLLAMVGQAVEQIGEAELVAEVNAEDLLWLPQEWPKLVEQISTDCRITLNDTPVQALGGILVRSSDNRIKLDNRFERRLSRMENSVHGMIMQRLFLGENLISSAL